MKRTSAVAVSLLAIGFACMAASGCERNPTQEPGLLPANLEIDFRESDPRLSDEVTLHLTVEARAPLHDVTLRLEATPGIRLADTTMVRIDSLQEGASRSISRTAVLAEPGTQELTVTAEAGSMETAGWAPMTRQLYLLVYEEGVYSDYTHIGARRDSVRTLFERGELSQEEYERALEALVTGQAETEVILQPE